MTRCCELIELSYYCRHAMLLLAIAGMPAAPSTADDHVEIGTKVYPKSRDIEFVDSLSKPINVDDIELPLEVSRI
ncbi:MAG TPA: hypothetical protein PLR25_24185, partial [Planctomycetaceae bacterium]|nr:hypothetical protein [Planctomycetaceae bacterium]